MTDKEKVLYNHLSDITKKIGTMAFNIQQLEFGRVAIVGALKKSLSMEKEVK